MECRRVARYIGEQDILDDVYEPDTYVATVVFQEIVNFLNPLIVCPCCIKQDTADRKMLTSGALVMRSLKSCFT